MASLTSKSTTKEAKAEADMEHLLLEAEQDGCISQLKPQFISSQCIIIPGSQVIATQHSQSKQTLFAQVISLIKN